MADSVSLSPNLISYSKHVSTQASSTLPNRSSPRFSAARWAVDGIRVVPKLTETETVSFSLTMGTTPMVSSSLNVFCALRYRVRCC